MPKILLVEDDIALAAIVKERLTQAYHTTDIVNDIRTAQDHLAINVYDLIIVDWNLPDGTGILLCQILRNAGKQVPVLMLTANDRIEHKEIGFGAGVDDYLTKPFAIKELLLRINALLRRPANIVKEVLKSGDLSLDLKTYELKKQGRKISLPPREFALLHFLMRHPDTVFTGEALLERVWPSSSEMTADAVRKYVCRLREKIDDKGCPSRIQTIHGVGYSFITDLEAKNQLARKRRDPH